MMNPLESNLLNAAAGLASTALIKCASPLPISLGAGTVVYMASAALTGEMTNPRFARTVALVIATALVAFAAHAVIPLNIVSLGACFAINLLADAVFRPSLHALLGFSPEILKEI